MDIRIEPQGEIDGLAFCDDRRPIRKNEVYVRTAEWNQSVSHYGKRPGGWGAWAFSLRFNHQGKACEVWCWATGKFAECRRAVVDLAAARGVRWVEVLP